MFVIEKHIVHSSFTTSDLYLIQCNTTAIITPIHELTCYTVARLSDHNLFTSGYIFGALLDVAYEQLLQIQEVSGV